MPGTQLLNPSLHHAQLFLELYFTDNHTLGHFYHRQYLKIKARGYNLDAQKFCAVLESRFQNRSQFLPLMFAYLLFDKTKLLLSVAPIPPFNY